MAKRILLGRLVELFGACAFLFAAFGLLGAGLRWAWLAGGEVALIAGWLLLKPVTKKPILAVYIAVGLALPLVTWVLTTLKG